MLRGIQGCCLLWFEKIPFKALNLILCYFVLESLQFTCEAIFTFPSFLLLHWLRGLANKEQHVFFLQLDVKKSLLYLLELSCWSCTLLSIFYSFFLSLFYFSLTQFVIFARFLAFSYIVIILIIITLSIIINKKMLFIKNKFPW